MTPTELLDIMRESGLPEAAWPCRPSDVAGLWMDREVCAMLTIEQSAALCEVALRRAIREAVGGSRPVVLTTAQGDHNWRAWITTTASDDGRVLHGDVYADTELHALARLHAAVRKENSK